MGKIFFNADDFNQINQFENIFFAKQFCFKVIRNFIKTRPHIPLRIIKSLEYIILSATTIIDLINAIHENE